jgi:hypothetical protein
MLRSIEDEEHSLSEKIIAQPSLRVPVLGNLQAGFGGPKLGVRPSFAGFETGNPLSPSVFL